MAVRQAEKKQKNAVRYDDDARALIKESFLVYYNEGLSWKEAAEAAGVASRTLLLWKGQDKDFAEQWIAIERSRHYDHAKCKEIFLATFEETFDVHYAADVAGPSYRTFLVWRKQDKTFAEAWRDIIKACLYHIKGARYRHALTTERGSEISAAILLNAYEPKRFRGTGGVGPGASNVTVNFIIGSPPAEEPKRLPPQSGNEITIDPDEEG